LAPAEVFDIVHSLGRLTPNDNVTAAFLSYLGDNKDTGTFWFWTFETEKEFKKSKGRLTIKISTGLIKEVSMDDVFVRPSPEPVNAQVTDNVKFLSDGGKAACAAPAKSEA
jgi:hypothetical protein